MRGARWVAMMLAVAYLSVGMAMFAASPIEGRQWFNYPIRAIQALME